MQVELTEQEILAIQVLAGNINSIGNDDEPRRLFNSIYHKMYSITNRLSLYESYFLFGDNSFKLISKNLPESMKQKPKIKFKKSQIVVANSKFLGELEIIVTKDCLEKDYTFEGTVTKGLNLGEHAGDWVVKSFNLKG